MGYTFIGVAMILSVFQYSLGTSITAESTQLVDEKMRGTQIGLEHCIFSGARIFTPSIGMTLLASGGVSALYLACSGIFFATLVMWSAFAGKFLPEGAVPAGAGKRKDR